MCPSDGEAVGRWCHPPRAGVLPKCETVRVAGADRAPRAALQRARATVTRRTAASAPSARARGLAASGRHSRYIGCAWPPHHEPIVSRREAVRLGRSPMSVPAPPSADGEVRRERSARGVLRARDLDRPRPLRRAAAHPPRSRHEILAPLCRGRAPLSLDVAHRGRRSDLDLDSTRRDRPGSGSRGAPGRHRRGGPRTQCHRLSGATRPLRCCPSADGATYVSRAAPDPSR